VRRGLVFLSLVVAAAALAAPASAVAPTLSAVTVHQGWVVATFSAPGADLVSLEFAPDTALDSTGRHFAHMVGDALSTPEELAAGRIDTANHSHENFGGRLDPGTWWAMLSAYPSNDCYPTPGVINPNCADGASNMVQITVAKPTPRYKGLVTVDEFGAIVELQVARSGEKTVYRVCWHRRNGKQACHSHTIEGGGWWDNTFEGRDYFGLSRRGLGKFTRFVWTVDGNVVATKRVRTNFR
jgi:hypothetical protein